MASGVIGRRVTVGPPMRTWISGSEVVSRCVGVSSLKSDGVGEFGGRDVVGRGVGGAESRGEGGAHVTLAQEDTTEPSMEMDMRLETEQQAT